MSDEQNEQNETIKILQIFASSLSLLGSLFIITIYFKMGMRNNFALKLIMCISISDIIYSISNLMYIDPGSNEKYIVLCIIQAFLIEYSSIACFIFCFLLSLCIYWTVIKNRNNLISYNLTFKLIGFGVPIIFAIIPLVTNCYGSQTFVCGIAKDEINNQSETRIRIEAILLLFVPLWILNIIGIYFIIRVSIFMTKLRNESQTLSQSRSSDQQQQQIKFSQQEYELKLSSRITKNMLAYPIIMLFCWSGMTIYGISKLCNSKIDNLEGVRFIMADFVGLLNSIAYGVNTIIILRLQKIMSQQQTMPMIQFKTGSGDSDASRKQFESFLSIATIYNDQ